MEGIFREARFDQLHTRDRFKAVRDAAILLNASRQSDETRRKNNDVEVISDTWRDVANSRFSGSGKGK